MADQRRVARAEEGARAPPLIAEHTRPELRRLRVHRGALQPQQTTLDPRLPLPRGVRERENHNQVQRLATKARDCPANARPLLSKVERGFSQDLQDVTDMLASGLVEPDRLRQLYALIEPHPYRYPAIDSAAFRRKLDAALTGPSER